MHISRLIPILLSILLILLFAWIALGFVFSSHCKFSICLSAENNSPVGPDAVLLKYLRDQSGYHVLGRIEVPSTCTLVHTYAEGSERDPLTIDISLEESTGECITAKVPRTFYVESEGANAPIRVLVNGERMTAAATEVQSLAQLTF